MRHVDAKAILTPNHPDMSVAAERKEHALAAIAREDWTELGHTGWTAVLDDLRYGWPPSRGGKANKLSAAEARVWVDALGDLEPVAVQAGLGTYRESGEVMRPYPSQIRNIVTGGKGTNRAGPNHTRRIDESAGAYEAIRADVANGGTICDCDQPPVNLTQSIAGVLRCAECGDLERGQTETAMGDNTND